MNDFSSASAILTALMSPKVAMLVLGCEKQAMQAINTLHGDLAQSSSAYYDTLRQTGTKELIPWLGTYHLVPPTYVCLTLITRLTSPFADPHLSTLTSTFAQSNPIVEVDGHHLIDFKLCTELARQIDSIAQYSPPVSPPPVSSEIRPDVLEYVEYHLQSDLALKDLHAAPVVGAGAHHSGKERRLPRRSRLTLTLAKREMRKSPVLKELWPNRPSQGSRADVTTQRRGALSLSLSHEKHTTRTRGERMAARQREEKARGRKERMLRRREGLARRDEGDVGQWREDMVRWRMDMERWRQDTKRWREDSARQAEKGLGLLLEKDVSVPPARHKGLMSRLFRGFAMTCREVL